MLARLVARLVARRLGTHQLQAPNPRAKTRLRTLSRPAVSDRACAGAVPKRSQLVRRGSLAKRAMPLNWRALDGRAIRVADSGGESGRRRRVAGHLGYCLAAARTHSWHSTPCSWSVSIHPSGARVPHAASRVSSSCRAWRRRWRNRDTCHPRESAHHPSVTSTHDTVLRPVAHAIRSPKRRRHYLTGGLSRVGPSEATALCAGYGPVATGPSPAGAGCRVRRAAPRRCAVRLSRPRNQTRKSFGLLSRGSAERPSRGGRQFITPIRQLTTTEALHLSKAPQLTQISIR